MVGSSSAIKIDLNQDPEAMCFSKFLSHLSTMDDDSEKVEMIHEFILYLDDEYKRLAASQHPHSISFFRDVMKVVLDEKSRCVMRVQMKECTSRARGSDENARGRDMLIIKDEDRNWLSSDKFRTTYDFFNNRQIINNEFDDGQIDRLSNNPTHENGPSMDMNLDPIQYCPSIHDGSSGFLHRIVQSEGTSSNPNLVREPTRKQRRDWTVELHKKFMFVVDALGGAREAKPKEIKDLMQVADLTIEQIKSHLQIIRNILAPRSYRRPAPSSAHNTHP